MALTITAFPDIKFVLGQSGRMQAYQIQPGAADYVTNGYVVAASSFELGYLFGVEVTATNAAGQLYDLVPVFPASTFGAAAAPATTVNLVVNLGGVQPNAGTDLSGITWLVNVYGW